MIKNPNDIGFIHDISSLDKLRKKAVQGDAESEQAALHAAARQFESIFTSMLFKSMREANSAFESDLMSSQNQDFYQQMLDEQMSSELSSSGSLGLADMIVKQLSANQGESERVNQQELAMRDAARKATFHRPDDRKAQAIEQQRLANGQLTPSEPRHFESPSSFIDTLRPYAERAAKTLGIEPSLLLAQAALETGWGKKVVQNQQRNSHNLFNIKADTAWQGDKVAKQTLEYHQQVPVTELASFRAYRTYGESFNDYVSFLHANPRYQQALQSNQSSEQFIQAVHRAGYATDPNYAEKVLRVKAKIEQM